MAEPDIVERLRELLLENAGCESVIVPSADLAKLGNEIERLRADLAYSGQRQQTLREELEQLRVGLKAARSARLPKKLREWVP